MKETEVKEVIIIGGGPIGIACGLACAKLNLNYLILEKGCLVNSLYNYPLNMTFFSTSEKLEIGNIPFVSINPKPNRQEALEYYRRVVKVSHLNVNLFEAVNEITQFETGVYQVVTNKATYLTNKVIVSTGFHDFPYLLNVPGESLSKVTHYFKDPHFYAFQNVLVVGANNSAVDAALETWRKGANVTMVIQNEEIGQRVKYWARPDIVNRINEGSIKAYFNSSIKSIHENEVIVKTPNGDINIKNDWVIAATGYQPNLDFLKSIGIELNSAENLKPIYNEETHETNQPGIYVAGVICGGLNTHSWFIENSIIHAEIIANHIKQKLNN
jgi:thioredoxin reductase (NADPH)